MWTLLVPGHPSPPSPRYYQREGDGHWMERTTVEPLRWPDGRLYEGREYPAWLR